jgi:hypothetical protein
MREAMAGGSNNPGVHTLVQETAGAFPIDSIDIIKQELLEI